MPKFKIGDKVHCFRIDTDVFWGFDFTGEVLSCNKIDGDFEYAVSNAPMLLPNVPLLIWESEMKMAPTKE